MDWSGVMTELPLLQRVAKTVEWWGCLFGWGENGHFGFGWGCKPQAADTWRWAVKPWGLGPDLRAWSQPTDTQHWGYQAIGARARPARLAADPGKRVRPERLGSAEPRVGSCVKTQFSWVRCQDPRFLSLRFLNIIICIIIIIIIKSIDIKNIIICLIIKSIDIKNITICLINIINIKNTIICIINIIILLQLKSLI